MWQDGEMSDAEAQAEGAHPATPDTQLPPQDADIEIIKALAAPIRLRILYALTRGSGGPRVMSAKELAEELGEPQTKLYRHLKMMESAGLIEVAETRLVSGILEQRYRAFEREYVIGRGPRTAARTSVEESAVTSVMRFFAESLFAARREGRIPPGDAADSGPHPKSLLAFSDRKVPASKAAELRRKLAEVADELTGPDDPDGVDVFTLIGFYSPAEPGSYPAESAPDPK